MHNIYSCVDSFTSLLNVQYLFILGRKNTSVSLRICFDKKDCFHLMGLQYLTDKPELSRDRGKIFDEIKNRKITITQIESSYFYSKISSRIQMLPYLEELFDSNDTIFKYHQKSNSFSLIQADYLMKNSFQNTNIYIFLSKTSNKTYFCRSFFPETNRNYDRNLPSWTLLYKEKTNIFTGNSIILFNKLNPNNM